MLQAESLQEKLQRCPLLTGLSHADISFLLEYLDAHYSVIEKGSAIYTPFEPIDSFALLLAGSLEMIQYDYWGNRFLILTQEPGDAIGLACTLFDDWAPPANIRARSKCEVLFLQAKKLRSEDCLTFSPCAHLKRNIAKQLAIKNITLLNKLSLIHCRSIREKVSMFLSHQAVQHHSDSFHISFTRQEMADFLSVDRCALSKELTRMKQDGLIDYHRNQFKLKKGSIS